MLVTTDGKYKSMVTIDNRYMVQRVAQDDDDDDDDDKTFKQKLKYTWIHANNNYVTYQHTRAIPIYTDMKYHANNNNWYMKLIHTRVGNQTSIQT